MRLNVARSIFSAQTAPAQPSRTTTSVFLMIPHLPSSLVQSLPRIDVSNYNNMDIREAIAGPTAQSLVTFISLLIYGAGLGVAARKMAWAFAVLLSWCGAMPRENSRALEGYFAIALRCLFFLWSTIVQMWLEACWSILFRNEPADGTAIERTVVMVVHTSLVLLYLLSFSLFSGFGALLHFIGYLWALSIPIAWIISLISVIGIPSLIATRLGQQGTGSSLYSEFMRHFFSLAGTLYRGFLLRIEPVRNLAGHLAKLVRPVLERWHFWNPTLLYVYKEFDGKEKSIRLIRLRRRYPGCDISCSLKNYSLAKAPPYEAISYTWGDGGKDHLVFFDGKWLPTTRNAHAILNDRSSYMGPRWIWIDAICINQNDNKEKNIQVAMMGEIYRTATRAVVWLDDRELKHNDFSNAMLLLEVISLCISSSVAITFNVMDLSYWESLHRLLSHPYWQRAWIVQEVALAKDVHIWHSHKYIAWSHLARLMFCFETNDGLRILAEAMNKLESGAIAGGAAQIGLISSLRYMAQGNNLQPLATCIVKTGICMAGDPRDRIFALNSLVEWPGGLDDPTRIKIDYAMKIEDVYEATARYFLVHDPRFALLAAGMGFERQITELRSWVPDFSMQLRFRSLEYPIPLEDRFNAGCHGGPRVQLRHDSTSLSAKVIFVSEISRITRSAYCDSLSLDGAQVTAERTRFFGQAWALADTMPSRYRSTGQRSEEAFWRTMVEDRRLVHVGEGALLKRPASLELGPYFLTHRRLFTNERSDHATSEGMESFDPEVLNEVGIEFSRLCNCACRERRFATTDSGLIGLVPAGTKVGDRLCVILGFEMPMLLREDPTAKEEYQFVGACYMHGIMDGEALEGASAETVVVN